MLKNVLLILTTLVIAIGGGAASVWLALDAEEAVGAVNLGGWTASPDLGTPQADPYAKARVAREGALVLGRAEGLAFVAQRDADGDLLRRECGYTIVGSMPPARFWTLYAADGQMTPLSSGLSRASALHSYEVLRQADNALSVTTGAHPAAGNWLAVQGSGAMTFVLTLYDTAIASSTGIADVELPRVVKAGCDA